MKKILSLSVIFLMTFFFCVSTQAVDSTTYVGGDFLNYWWMETLEGGSPGQTGNKLMAYGQGFTFTAVLQAPVVESPDPAYEYKTTYIDGVLRLTPWGPWKKWVKVTGIEATNLSKEENGILKFKLTFNGTFKADGKMFDFEVTATYEGEPIVTESYHMSFGPNFITQITITEQPQ